MKKIIFMVVMAVMAITASAQVEPGFRMGVRANLGLSNVVAEDSKMSFGYGVGWIAEYNFESKWFVQSGIGIEDIAHKDEKVVGTLNGYFAQLPIHAGYRFGLGDSSSLFVQAGPTIGVGLFGTSVAYPNKTVGYFERAKRFDLGLGGRVGMEFSNYQISVGANYGVLEASDGEGHNLSANIGFAYMFK